MKKPLITDMMDLANEEANNQNDLQDDTITPFQEHMVRESSPLEKKYPPKRSMSKINNEFKGETIPMKRKKPVRRSTPIRTTKRIFTGEENGKNLPRKKRRDEKSNADVLNDEASTSIQKIRELQEHELNCLMGEGTYVQCCGCSKWR